MKLKCKQTVSRHFYRGEIEFSTLLTKDKEYVALGISFSAKNRYVCLETNDELPAFLDIRQFEVLSTYVPSCWAVRYKMDVDHLSFFPKLWVETNTFWDGLFEKQEPEMFKLYCQERDLIFWEEKRLAL